MRDTDRASDSNQPSRPTHPKKHSASRIGASWLALLGNGDYDPSRYRHMATTNYGNNIDDGRLTLNAFFKL